MRRQLSLKHLVSASGLLVILLLSVTYLYSGVLNRSVTRQPDIVTVALAETGGLFPGSGVTYRGVRVGTVDDIVLSDSGVSVTARLDTTRDIPADSEAVVRSLSPAGEQFLDIQPRSDGPPYLANGTLFGRADTATPTSVASALDSVDRLVSGIDEKDIATILRELSTAFRDPDDLGRLVTAAQSTVRTLDENWPETERLIENGRTVLRAGADSSDELSDFASSSRSLAAWLRDYDPSLRRQLDQGPAGIGTVRELVSDLQAVVPELVGQTADLTTLAGDRTPHLRELLQVFPRGSERLSSTLVDDRLNIDLLISPGEVCTYGREPLAPKRATRTPVAQDGRCTESFSLQQRGADHAPGPTR